MQICGKHCHIHPGVPLFMVGGEWECLKCDEEFWKEKAARTTANSRIEFSNN